MTGLINKLANYALTVTCIYGFCYLFVKVKNNTLSCRTRRIIFAWGEIFTSIGVKEVFFTLAIRSAPDGQYYHPTFLAWKWLVLLCTTALFVHGMVSFIALTDTDHWHNPRLIHPIIILSAIGLALTF